MLVIVNNDRRNEKGNPLTNPLPTTMMKKHTNWQNQTFLSSSRLFCREASLYQTVRWRMRIRPTAIIVSALLLIVAVFAVSFTGVRAQPAAAKEAMPPALSLEEALKKARVGGKYAMLLRQFKVEKDAETYKDFADIGVRDQRDYAGQMDLPKGHWVYVYPYWYVWRDLTSGTKAKRAWGPEQVIGEPDALEGGDNQNAWASLTPDGQDEWLLVEYAEPVVPRAVHIYENYAPGAVNRITAFRLDGTEVELWKGEDPTSPDDEKGISIIPVKVDFKTNRLKIYIDSRNVPNWNEIDAVGLKDADGKMHWVTAAEASSTYAQQQEFQPFIPNSELMGRISRMEAELKELKEQNKELKEMLRELKDLLKEKNKKEQR
jgi:hypothetical protein